MCSSSVLYSVGQGCATSTDVIEHLIIHEELFYREAKVITSLPYFTSQPDSLFASDESILGYSEITDQNKGRSPWYLEPKGRWSSKEIAMRHYQLLRQEMIRLVSQTDKDLRRYYTESGRGPTQYRDLHQLLLISVAHTKRHHQQILNLRQALPKSEVD